MSSRRYRRRARGVEAFQYSVHNWIDIATWLAAKRWVKLSVVGDNNIQIPSEHGKLTVRPGDYIVLDNDNNGLEVWSEERFSAAFTQETVGGHLRATVIVARSGTSVMVARCLLDRNHSGGCELGQSESFMSGFEFDD